MNFAPSRSRNSGHCAVRSDGEVAGHDPAAARDVVHQALAQPVLDRLPVVSQRLQPLHVRVRRLDPRPGAVVHHDGVEVFDLPGREHGEVAADDRLEGPGLLAQRPEGVLAEGNAVALVRVLVHQRRRRVPDQHGAGFLRRRAGLLGAAARIFSARCGSTCARAASADTNTARQARAAEKTRRVLMAKSPLRQAR